MDSFQRLVKKVSKEQTVCLLQTSSFCAHLLLVIRTPTTLTSSSLSVDSASVDVISSASVDVISRLSAELVLDLDVDLIRRGTFKIRLPPTLTSMIYQHLYSLLSDKKINDSGLTCSAWQQRLPPIQSPLSDHPTFAAKLVIVFFSTFKTFHI